MTELRNKGLLHQCAQACQLISLNHCVNNLIRHLVLKKKMSALQTHSSGYRHFIFVAIFHYAKALSLQPLPR